MDILKSALAKIHSLGSDLEETIYGGFILMCLQTINQVFQYEGNHVFVQIDFFFFHTTPYNIFPFSIMGSISVGNILYLFMNGILV